MPTLCWHSNTKDECESSNIFVLTVFDSESALQEDARMITIVSRWTGAAAELGILSSSVYCVYYQQKPCIL